MLSKRVATQATGTDSYVLALGVGQDAAPALLRARDVLHHMVILDDDHLRAQQWEDKLIAEQTRAGGSWVVFDLWPTAEREAMLAGFLREDGRGADLHIFDPLRPDRSAQYSMTRAGSPAVVAAKLMTLLTVEPPAVHARALQDTLVTIITALTSAKLHFTLRDMALLLQYPQALTKLEEALVDDHRNDFRAWNTAFKNRKGNQVLKKHMRKLAQRLSAFAAGEWGDLINGKQPSLSFADLVANNQCLYVAVPVVELGADAMGLVGAMLRDLAADISERSENEQKLTTPYMVFLSDTARRADLSTNLLDDATKAGFGFVSMTHAAEADKDIPGFSGALLNQATKLLSGTSDYALRSVADFLGVTDDMTLVVRSTADRAMQLVARPAPQPKASVELLPPRHPPLALMDGGRMFGLEAFSTEFARANQVTTLQTPMQTAAVGD